MSEHSFISISAYAKAVGVSRQTAYNRLETTLQPFIVIGKNGKKMLDARCLETENCQVCQDETVKTVKPDCKEEVSSCQDNLSSVSNDSTSVNWKKIAEDRADKINKLEERLEKLEDHIMQQSADITQILKDNQKLQEELHQLMAMSSVRELQEHKEQTSEDTKVSSLSNEVSNSLSSKVSSRLSSLSSNLSSAVKGIKMLFKDT